MSIHLQLWYFEWFSKFHRWLWYHLFKSIQPCFPWFLPPDFPIFPPFFLAVDSAIRPNKTAGHWPIKNLLSSSSSLVVISMNPANFHLPAFCWSWSTVSMIEGKTSGNHVQIVMVYRLTPSNTWCHDGVFVHIAICPGLELSSFAWGSSLTVPELGVLGCWDVPNSYIRPLSSSGNCVASSQLMSWWRVWQESHIFLCVPMFGYMPKWIGTPKTPINWEVNIARFLGFPWYPWHGWWKE